MLVEHKVILDVLRPENTVLHVVQDDSVQTVHLYIRKDGNPFRVVDDATEAAALLKFIVYCRADGVSGEYEETLGEDAVEVVVKEVWDGEQQAMVDTPDYSEWICRFDGACFAKPGKTRTTVRFMDENGHILHMFPIDFDVVASGSGITEPNEHAESPTLANLEEEISDIESYNTANYRLSYTIRNVLSTNFIPRSTIATGKTKIGDILVDPSGNLARVTSEATVGGVNGWQIMALGNRIAEAPENIAPIYSSSATYAVGDYVHYAGALYCCNTTISTAEAWTAAHWDAAVLGSDFAARKILAYLYKTYGHIVNVDNYVVALTDFRPSNVKVNDWFLTGDLHIGKITAISGSDVTVTVTSNGLVDTKEYMSNIAANYSSSATYAVGDYCHKDGVLYRCKTAISTAESWTAAHWESTTVGAELKTDASLTISGAAADAKATGDAVGELKRGIEEISLLIPYYGVKEYAGLLKANGTYGNTTQFHSLTTWKIKCAPGDKFIYRGLASGTAVSALFYNNDAIVDTYAVDARTNPAEVTIPSGCNGVVFSSYAGISSDVIFDLVGKSSLKYTTSAALEEAETGLQTQIDQLKKISVSIETGFTTSHYIAYATGNYTEHQNTNYLASGYVDVSLYAGHTLSLLCTVAGSVTGLAFYKADRTYISGIGGGSVVPYQGTNPQAVSGTIPTNAVYMRFTGYSAFSTNIKDYNVTVEISALGDALGVLNKLFIAEKNSFTTSHYIVYNTGNYALHDNENYLASDYVDVRLYAGRLVTLMCTIAGSTGVAFYKADKTYISGFGSPDVASTGTTPQKVTVTIPSNAAYMRFTGYATFSSDIKDYNVFVSAETVGGALSDLVNGNGTEIDNIIKSDYVSLSMFEKIGVIGDSYASGEIYVGGSGADYYNLSWGQNVARMCGVTCVNYSRGGLTTKTWLSDTTYGLAKLLSDDPLQLYMICLGLNDYGQIGQGTYSLGTIDDVKQDYTQNPDTFYGNYGRIIGNIKTHAPNAKIIMCTVTEGQFNDFSTVNAAIVAIAEVLELPLINLRDDSFFTSQFYRDTLVSNHPVAVGYSAYAKGIMRLFAKCAIDNLDYFKNYVG